MKLCTTQIYGFKAQPVFLTIKKILLIKLGRNGKKTGHSMKTISAAELGMLEQLCSHWNTKFTVMWNGTMLHYSTHFFQAVTQVGFLVFF